MNEPENILEVADKPEIPTGINIDLRPPKVSFGRCIITGEWGKVVNLDPGDMILKFPNLANDKIDYDPATGQVNFQEYEDMPIQTNISISAEGLKQLMDFVESEDNPIPPLSHDSVYMWSVLYKDGGGLRQFGYGEDTLEKEFNSNEIEWERVAQFNVIPRENTDLPTYTFVKESGKFFKNGIEVDTEFDGDYDSGATLFYARKVTHTMSSGMAQDGLTRFIGGRHTSVLQLLGWHCGPRANVEDQSSTEKGFVLAIDERGSSRGWWEHS